MDKDQGLATPLRPLGDGIQLEHVSDSEEVSEMENVTYQHNRQWVFERWKML